MKKIIISAILAVILLSLSTVEAEAAALDIFEDPLNDLRAGLSDDVSKRLNDVGWSGSFTDVQDISLSSVAEEFAGELSAGLSGPLSAFAVTLAVILLSSLVEGCTYSLRYIETREIMSVISSLMLITVLAAPAAELISSASSVIYSASGLMLLYVPVMAGLRLFSGAAASAGGYFTSVMAVSQLIAQFSAHVLSPALKALLALAVAVSAGVRSGIRGLFDAVYNCVKWSVIFLMTVFTAVISIQGILSGAADTVASRAARFTLSSFVPLVGSAISEAYRAIQGSVDILRSGAGVFVILALILTFMPHIIQAALWLCSIRLSKLAAEALGTEAPAALLSSIGSVISVLIAVSVSVMAVCIISAAVMLSAGGRS